MDSVLVQVAGAADFVKGRTSDGAVFVAGIGVGGEVAFQVTNLHESSGIVVDNVLVARDTVS